MQRVACMTDSANYVDVRGTRSDHHHHNRERVTVRRTAVRSIPLAPTRELPVQQLSQPGLAQPHRSPVPTEAAQGTAKRIFDIVAASLALLLLLPALLAIALTIQVTSPGPVLFRQVRRGRGGVPFACYKFRTMYTDAGRRLSTLLDLDPNLRHEFDTTRKLRSDPRVTWIGRFLRRSSLDELPQLLNVLRGQMSVVGPRPIVDAETVMYGRSRPTVERVRPGMTGLWQVSGRNDLPYEIRVQLDEHYSTTHSLWFDLRIIARTVMVVVRGHGAY